MSAFPARTHAARTQAFGSSCSRIANKTRQMLNRREVARDRGLDQVRCGHLGRPVSHPLLPRAQRARRSNQRCRGYVVRPVITLIRTRCKTA